MTAPTTRVHRTPWGEFPNVALHTNLVLLRLRGAYRDAKEGDFAATRRLVDDFYRPDSLKARVNFIALVIRLDANERWNAIPLALAVKAAATTGAKVVPTIVQSNIVAHTNADGSQRILHQPTFTGRVPRGSYLIVDDVVTSGSTLANLRGYIESHGQRVLQASTLSAGLFATKLRPEPSLIQHLKKTHSDELKAFTAKLGFDASCLTHREARYLHGLKTLESLGNPAAQEKRAVEPAVGPHEGGIRGLRVLG